MCTLTAIHTKFSFLIGPYDVRFFCQTKRRFRKNDKQMLSRQLAIYSCTHITEAFDHGGTSPHEDGVKVQVLVFILDKLAHLFPTLFALNVFIVVL